MKTSSLSRFARDPVAFITRFIRKNELGQPFTLLPHQVEILRAAFTFDETGRLPWDTFIYSCTKKSGKTTLNAMLTTWWAFSQEPPNELKLIANDQEQSISRTFNTIKGLLRFNPELGQSADVRATEIRLSNGTTIQAIACDFAGEAGANHGLTSWTELWGYTSESARRLWEEFTPVPTRRNSIRIIDTYAGFEGESILLKELYFLAVDSDEHSSGQGERVHQSLPLFVNRPARVFCYWDHEARMPWQTEAYYEAQKRQLRASAFLRLHRNQWVSSESIFVTAELWDACVDDSLLPVVFSHGPTELDRPVVVGAVDASVKGDSTAAVIVMNDGDRIRLIAHKIWQPTAHEPIDFEATVERFLRELDGRFILQNVYYDPYQFHRSATTLRSDGIPMREFPQTVANTSRMGQVLYDLIQRRVLRLYPSDELRQQALNAVAIETPRGFRLAKEKASKKIDAIAALAMSCCGALDFPQLAPLMLIDFDLTPRRRSAQEVQEEHDLEMERRKQEGAREIAEACARDGYFGFPD